MLTRERPRTPAFLPLAPLPSLTTAFSRRAAIFGAATSAGVLAGSAACAVAPASVSPSASRPRGPLTLAQAEALDFEALWCSLPIGVQAGIGALVLRNEMFLQLVEDGGFHTTADDREDAQTHADAVLDTLRPAIWAALPAMMPTVYDEPYPLWQVLDTRGGAPAEVDVHGLGPRPLVPDGWQWFARDGERLRELGGAVDLDSADEGAPRRWQFWTIEDIDAERLRRHPEMAERGGDA